YPERYDDLSDIAKNGFSPYQLYNTADLMGEDYFKGYAGMKSIDKLEFPRDYGPHNDFQCGWYFFSSSFKDQNGKYVDLLVLFTRRAIYPPPIAEAMNLSEMDNQIIDFQIALGLGDRNLFISDFNPVISGKTGLIEMKAQPFLVRIGKNEIKSVRADSLFPMTINAYDPKNDIKIDLTLEATKPLFLQGDDGKLPDMFNLGTWYFSVPGIKTTGTINYAGDKRTVSGKTWFDNQWTAGVFPAGYPNSYYIRSLSNMMNGMKGKPADPWAWDWLQIQLDNNIDFTLASMHSSRSEDLKNLGSSPPENATRDVTGKMIDEQGRAEEVEGTVTIDRWVKSDVSGAWHPNGWIV
ncbi:MAG: carotenoid 1,2-hydratase, partial [Deltaproteobacteria bacterium]|nr:carotenoid 1,2-hydratase [Deltaproteobacteria bacterium]